MAVRIEGRGDPIREKISTAGWGVIMAYYYEPYEMMANVLAQMYRAGELGYDPNTGHLLRSSGPCNYCVNERWQFPEGCRYGNDRIRPYPSGLLESVVVKILAGNKQ